MGSLVTGAKVTSVVQLTAPTICPTIPIQVAVPITVTAIVSSVTSSSISALFQTVDARGVTLDVAIG
jgi:hypothetical protein